MTVRRLSAVDAQTYWMSAKIPNDTVLLYGFDGVPADLDATIEEIAQRARGCPDLTVCIEDGGRFRYPAWVHHEVDSSQFVVHNMGDSSFQQCLDEARVLTAERLEARVAAWRMHVFTGIEGVPGVGGPGTVAVLHISHALGGGGRTSAPAAIMFGRRNSVVPGIDAPRTGPVRLPIAGFRAARAHRQLVEDTEAGRVPAPADLRPALRTNDRPAGSRYLRTLVRRRSDLNGPTVTVAALSAVSGALAAQLRCLGEDPSFLGAEVPMVKPPPRLAYNHFGNVGVGLYPELAEPERGVRIAADLDARRRRAAHPAIRMADRAFAATPAPLLRWGMDRFDPNVRVSNVTGNTVVSSVNCGEMDFHFGGARVTVACAFPGLSPMMGLTHAVCGVGDTILLSVHAAESAIGDIDAYVERLDAAL
ncbi:WS/DGAT domain-containing protein [Mycolicibacterium gadium]|uniref:WS/DGAT domain-containing protein n=1 Tax=Mycolicibacterium gadium TaxID=1794 RepID=A0ABT6GTH5_MYCGU|nr:WS/DGAT domain-containing protein [Mycolicibacterium gadium]MDG5484929.1 WS/DGAT domain-containing protein [Mycolicibacterium gadium]